MFLSQAMVNSGLVGCQSEGRRLIAEGVIRVKNRDSAWLRDIGDVNHSLPPGRWEIVIGQKYKVWKFASVDVGHSKSNG